MQEENERKYYRLWWEYLRRSDEYKDVCEKWRLWRQDRDEQVKRFKLNLHNDPNIIPLGEVRYPNPRDYKTNVCSTFSFCDDVFQMSSEEWYGYMRKERVLNIKVKGLVYRDLVQDYNQYMLEDLEDCKRFLQKKLHREPTIGEVQELVKKRPPSAGEPCVVDMSQNYFSLEKVRKRLTFHKKKRSKGLQENRLRLANIESYLRAYDISQRNDISGYDRARLYQPGKIVENTSQASAYDTAVRKAKRIITNTANGTFPGSYSD